jgi:adenylosuccinate lyase
MVGRTHGQKAVPTTLGKELAVFVYRLHKLYAKIKKIKLEGKLSGAVGNYNALKFLDSQKNWIKISEEFVKSLGMEFTPLTTQILPLDSYLELFNLTKLVNSVLAGFCQDIWNYASYEYLIIASTEKQVGSSTMPHKVNPIDFENAEGNLGIANSLLSFFADKLPISRLQRDLSDSTVKRNFGVAFGHTMLAFESLLLGLEKISADKQKMLDDLNSDWSILSEAIQTQLRAGMFARGFEKVMAETQGRKMSRKDFLLMVRKLNIDKKILNKLESLSPEEYTGEAINLVELIKV